MNESFQLFPLTYAPTFSILCKFLTNMCYELCTKLLKIIFKKTQVHNNKNALKIISIQPLLFIFQKDIKKETDG